MKLVKLISLGVLILAAAALAAGCKKEGRKDNAENNADTEGKKALYQKIDGDYAKGLMDSEEGYIILDTRTQEEYDQGHIDGAILIPEYEIAEKAADILPDKDQLILVYCRSGRRSKIASEALVDMGYTNVYDFGGIIDWNYETVK